jgi:hypothetical protein
LLSLAVVGLLPAARPADAASGRGSPAARLVYSRTAEASSCPAEPVLRAAVAARVGYDPFFPWGKATIVVQISRARSRYVAHVELLDDAGIALGVREISSAHGDCSEIFDAAALAISIALDAASKKIAPDPHDDPTTSPATESAAPSPPPPPPPPAPVVPSPDSVPDAPDEALPSPDTGPGVEFRLEGGIDLVESFGTAPSTSPGASVFARGRVQWWSLSLELLADLPASAARPSESGGGRVGSWEAGAGLASCVHVGPFAVCAVGSLGSLMASGHDIDPQSSKATLFAMAGARLALEWPIGRTLALRLRGDGVVNLRRVNLALGDDDIVWRAPPIAGTLGAGLVARFR